MCTENTKITIAIVNFETTTLTNACIRSIVKNVKMFDYTILVLDNSRPQNKFSLDDDMRNDIKIIDNTHQKYLNFDNIIKNMSDVKTGQHAAFKHACSIQFLINLCTTETLVILDSDTLLYKDLDFIDNRYVTCSDIQVKWISPSTKNVRYTRFIPFIQSFNIELLKKYKLKYFNSYAIIDGKGHNSLHYDTGSFFYEQVLKLKLPYKHICFPLYIKHLSAGSEHKDDKKIKKFLNDNKSCYDDNLKVDVIVSMTSFKPRYASLVDNLKSIENQEFNGNYDIMLTLCDEDLNNLPLSLKFYIAQSKIKLMYASKNIRAHKKYFYVMCNDKKHPIITLDDDCIYSQNLIQKLYNEYIKTPNYILAFRTHKMILHDKKILSYSKWKQKIYETEPSHELFATGIGGVLYPPDCLKISNNDLNMVFDFINNDDFFLKTKEILNNIKVRSIQFDKIKYPFIELEIGHDKNTSLYFSENLNGGNDKLIQKMNQMNLIF